MSKLFAMAIPILPGKEAEWKKWHDELRTTRYNEFANSRKEMNVHERTFLQHTPMGDLVIVTLEGDDPQGAFAQFAAANDDFTKWFIANVKQLHGVDLTQPPTGPMPELVIDSKS
jgi:L-rhamnose mutarotase